MRRDSRVLLMAVVESADAIADAVTGVSFDDYCNSRLIRAAVEREFISIGEALNNLSKVLRDRKKMKAKIRAVSQEAKSSAAIIGALPFVIMGALTVLNPNYLNPLFDTSAGNVMLLGCGLWMLTGVLVMRKMINFEI